MIRLCCTIHIWRIPSEQPSSNYHPFLNCVWLFPLTRSLPSPDWSHWWATLLYTQHSHWQLSYHHIIFPRLLVYISDIAASQDLLHTTPLPLPFSVVALTDQERQSFLIIHSLLWQIHFKYKMLWVFQHFYSVVVLLCTLMWHDKMLCVKRSEISVHFTICQK